MTFKIVSTTLASDVATSGTFDVSYPTGLGSGDFADTAEHKMAALGTIYKAPDDFTVSFGSSAATVTYNGTTTIPAGTTVTLQFDQVGIDSEEPAPVPVSGVRAAPVYIVDLGSPDTADANGVAASQAGTAATALTLDGALVVNGVAVFDVPRNVVGGWTTSAKITVTGEDAYGNTIVETTASAGTSHAGKKAFKKVTSVVPDTNITGCTVGTGDVLGIPCRLPDGGLVLKELQDDAAPTAGTLVAGIAAKSTATTGDVRGTYDPNAACDGAKNFKLVAIVDPSDKGVSQYAG
ncbi:MAG TPA: hypothetical protein VKA19_05345 [Alphaproteobacteria bacterium]|nr:hypothetical protein [Alphaproteobacteria bacterium]